MAITLIAMIIAFGIFFVHYDAAGTGTKAHDHTVLIAMGVCFFFAFFGPFITGDF